MTVLHCRDIHEMLNYTVTNTRRVWR